MSATPQRRIELDGPREAGWHELWLKEDWWAVWLGLGLVVMAFALFAGGSSIAWIAVAPAKWSTSSELGGQLAANAPRLFSRAGWLRASALSSISKSASSYLARPCPSP